MDGDQDNTLQHGSRQDVSPAIMNGVSAEITEEISPSQHERWRDLVSDIQLRTREDAHDDFLRANESFTPSTPSPVTKRFNFSPMESPRIGRRVGSMSPSSSEEGLLSRMSLTSKGRTTMQILRKVWHWCMRAEISIIFQEHGLLLIS
ncbi:BnaCnng02850D [Brassica napus]|uniref:BnaCnng02850D protein n=1 Tax=Brassica napus TaxID=3708 RepID=A0A078FBL0_BRANA|nr:BnaCnng02850D [Brassica napus]